MKDIVERLRAIVGTRTVYDRPIIKEAADEIEIREGRIARLEAEIRRLEAVEAEWEIIGTNYAKQVRMLSNEIEKLRAELRVGEAG